MRGQMEADSNIELRAAVEKNDIDGAVACLNQGANPNAKYPGSGLTPLMLACGYGYEELAKLLLERGADPNCADSKGGAFPIHKACQGGHLAIVKLLVEWGAMVDCQSTATGHTPLMEAMWFKFSDIVEYLLEQNAKLTIPTHYGFSLADHLAYELKVNQKPDEQAKLKAIDAAVKKRQDRDQASLEGNPLMDAVTKDDVETVKALLKEGFPVDKRTPYLGTFNDAHTPLLVAVRDGHYEAAKCLLSAGADPNAVEPTFLAVPLHKATYNGRVDMTRLLLDQPDIDIDYQGPTNGYSPLHDALWHGFEECAKLLIDVGANLSLRGHDGKRPIDLANDVFGEYSVISNYIRERME